MLSVDNPDILKEYYRKMLERLEVYDLDNGMGYGGEKFINMDQLYPAVCEVSLCVIV